MEQKCSLDEAIRKAKSQARYFYRNQPSADHANILSWAVFGAYVAHRDYDAARGMSWNSYLFQVVRHHMLKSLRPTNAGARSEFLKEHSFVQIEEQHLQNIADDVDPTQQIEARVAITSYLTSLEPKDRWIIVQRFYYDRSYRELGKVMRCSDQEAMRRERRAIARLRHNIGVDNLDALL